MHAHGRAHAYGHGHIHGYAHARIRTYRLINPETHELKLADFGSAKCIVPGRKNVTYICSRFYRAPELILDRELYGPGVDVWAFGCILAEVSAEMFTATIDAHAQSSVSACV